MGSEGASPIPGLVNLYRPDLGLECLRARTITRVPTATTSRLVLVITQVLSQFGLHTPFEYRFNQLREEPALTSKLDPAIRGRFHELIKQIIINQLTTKPTSLRLSLRNIRHSHSQSSFS